MTPFTRLNSIGNVVIILTLLGGLMCAATSAYSWGLILRAGPPSIGTGGPNPLGIPPQVYDLELSGVSNQNWECNIGVPGLLIGKRIPQSSGTYFALGGGLVFNAHGSGPGVYSAFGYDVGWPTFKFNFEYKQALGITTKALISPYAVRIGGGLWF